MFKKAKKAGLGVIGEIVGPLFRKNEESDMHLPDWTLGMGLLLMVGGIALAVINLSGNIKLVVAGIVLLVVGVFAVLCYCNQKLFMLPDDRFRYRTFLGNEREYSFSEVEKLVKNRDSLTLFVRGEKVHIESSAILSERFVERLNQVLAGPDAEN